MLHISRACLFVKICIIAVVIMYCVENKKAFSSIHISNVGQCASGNGTLMTTGIAHV